VLSSMINGWFRSPAALSDEQLEDTWLDFKAKLLQTSPHENEKTYSTTYSTCTNLLTGIVHRHRHILLTAEARSPFYNYVREYKNGIRTVESAMPNNIPTEVLSGLVLLAYRGGRTATTCDDVLPNATFVINGISCLIHEKKDPLGLFLKGLVLKYGIQLFLHPNLQAAEKYLSSAKSEGVGAATIELAYLGRHHYKLDHIRCIHQDPNNYQQKLLVA
jgi:hypothetical protein